MAPVVVGALLLVACGASSSPRVETPTRENPARLLGAWQVEVGGAETGDVLRLRPGKVALRRDCGALHGAWAANRSGMFVAYLYGAPARCSPSAPMTPPWLEAAVAYRIEGGRPVLLGAGDEVVARLRQSTADPPAGDDVRHAFGAPASAPSGLEPASPRRLLGRWVPSEVNTSQTPEQPMLEFRRAGSWRGSDGCNQGEGRWVSRSSGELLAVPGPQTLVFCRGVPVAVWLAQSRWAGFDGDELVLVGADGKPTGRMRRA